MSNEEHLVFAKNLSTYMEREDISGASLGKRSGVPQKTVWTIQNGAVKPTLNNMKRLCDGLNIDLGVMLIDGVTYDNIRASKRYGRMFKKFLQLPESKKEIVIGMVNTFAGDEEKGE